MPDTKTGGQNRPDLKAISKANPIISQGGSMPSKKAEIEKNELIAAKKAAAKKAVKKTVAKKAAKKASPKKNAKANKKA